MASRVIGAVEAAVNDATLNQRPRSPITNKTEAEHRVNTMIRLSPRAPAGGYLESVSGAFFGASGVGAGFIPIRS